MPAPVTTTIFLHLATDRDRPYSARRVEGSAWKLSRSRAMGMVLQLHGVYAREAGREQTCGGGWEKGRCG